jgi:LPXTG-site transpeptidase (sortase) family protein
MQEPSSGGFLSRLRENETLRRLTGGRPELLIFGAPVALIAAVAIVVVVAVAAGGGGDDKEATAPTATRVAGTATPRGTPTPGENAGLKTPIAFSPGDFLTEADLAARGRGEPARGPFEGQRLVIPKIGVDAEFSIKPVGADGQMPNPNGPWDVAWYDFSSFPGLGGIPLVDGNGGNIVLAGHVDYINVGPAVFWDLHTLQPGDEIQVVLADGSMVRYAVEFNKVVDPNADDWSSLVQATADESVTLITCSGEFSAGHYSNRQIVWGRRIA